MLGLKKREIIILLLLLGINLLFIIYTGQITLRNFPNSADEYVQYFTAETFASGRLYIPTPEYSEFFGLIHTINDGKKIYGVFPPGWPLFLSIGIILNIPWLLNPLFGILTLLLIYFIAKENFSEKAALISVAVTLFNPYFIFNSASYFTHPAAQFFMALFVLFYFRCLNDISAKRNYVLMGITAGFGYITRPYTTFAILLPLGIFLVYHAFKSQQFARFAKNALITAAILAAFFSLNLFYNYTLTGDPFLDPVVKYQPCIRPAFMNDCDFDYKESYKGNIQYRLDNLGAWLPFPLFFIFLYIFQRERNRKGLLILSIFITLLAAYFFVGMWAGNEYGPRYIYESAFAIFLITGISLSNIDKKSLIALAIIIIMIFNIHALTQFTPVFSKQIEERTEIFELVKNQNISNAIVFLKTGSGDMADGDLKRNGIYFNESVLYVGNQGEHNIQLMKMFPDRATYYYIYNNTEKSGMLIQFDMTNITVKT